MTLSRTLAIGCAAVLLPFAAQANAAGPKGVSTFPPAPKLPASVAPKTAEQARAELATMRADGTLQRYQSLRTPPPIGVRNPSVLRKDLTRPVQTAQDYRAVYVGG